MERRGMLEDVAEELLEELINRCLVQVRKTDSSGIRVKTCHIHDLLRDLCVDKAGKENFFEIIQPPLTENYGLPVDVSLSTSMSRRIAIHPSKRYVCLNGEHGKLRSLLLFQNEELIDLQISKCNSFNFLRILKVVKKESDKWHVSNEIGNLYHLRYLELKCSKKVILPLDIGKLKNLQSLRVEGVGVTTPNILFELEHLRHVLLVDYVALWGEGCLLMPQSFASKNIETLKHIWVENLIESNALLSLTNIQSLGIIFKRSKEVEPILKALTQLHRLRSLHMRRSMYGRLIDDSIVSYSNLELLSQCHHLSKLFLEGKIHEDPHSSHHVLKFIPVNIVKLTLWATKLEQDPMAELEKLPHLKILQLKRYSYTGIKLICSANGFFQLDYLHIETLFDLEEWEIEEGAMPRLRSLFLCDIPNLKMFPEGLRYITALQEMKLSKMKRSLIERIKVKDGREGEDFSKVSHIRSIQLYGTLQG